MIILIVLFVGIVMADFLASFFILLVGGYKDGAKKTRVKFDCED